MSKAVKGKKFPDVWWAELLFLFLMAVLTCLIYANAIDGPFIFDDSRISDNQRYRLESISLESLLDVAINGKPSTRPVANVSFALNYYVHQYQTRGYHLVNIFIHIVVGIFLYYFFKTTIRLHEKSKGHEVYSWLPIITTLIWIVHPIQTQSVSYIVQRMTSLSAMFYVLSMLCYARGRLCAIAGRKWLLLSACFLSGLLALGSKETAATLPFFILLYEWYFFQDLRWSWSRQQIFLLTLSVFVLGGLIYFFLGDQPIVTLLAGYQKRDFTMLQRVMTEFRVVVFYMSLLLFPHPSRLNLNHDFNLSFSLFDPLTTMFSLAAIAALLCVAVLFARRQRLLSFCLLWFLGNLVIESSIVGLEIIFEHRLYLPSAMFTLLLVFLADRYVRLEYLKPSIILLVVALFSVWTFERNNLWNDSIELWKDSIQKAPYNERAHNNLGASLMRRGKASEAITHYLEAIKMTWSSKNGHFC